MTIIAPSLVQKLGLTVENTTTTLLMVNGEKAETVGTVNLKLVHPRGVAFL